MSFVADQLGHSNPSITLRVYARIWCEVSQADQMREALEARFGNGVVTSDGKTWEKTANEETAESGKVLQMAK